MTRRKLPKLLHTADLRGLSFKTGKLPTACARAVSQNASSIHVPRMFAVGGEAWAN